MRRPESLLVASLRPLKISGREVDWTEALCRGEEPDWWFVDEYKELRRVTAAAIEKCNECPIRGECLEYALENDMKFGVWGGLTSKQRSILLGKKRNR